MLWEKSFWHSISTKSQ